MGQFLTENVRIEQTDKLGYFKTLDNELFMDDDGTLYLTPRYFWTDGYTFPRLVMVILGDKNRYNVRPAHAHDLFCRFHQCIKVKLSLTQLRLMNLLREHNGKMVCEDIPKEHLEIAPISKWETDELFNRMMKACAIDKKTRRTIRFGVFFNIGWYLDKVGDLTNYDLFNRDIGLINGV